ncbi:MAG: serine/threonine protein kinase, partial [Faecousia sp.]
MEEKRCYGCMKLKKNSPICEHCGYDDRQTNAPHQLPGGTVLKEQYLVGKVLGQGGFGITYLGWDLYLDIPVAVKEYYPAGVVMRDTTVTLDVVSSSGDEGARFRNNKERFLREAKMLARFSQVPEIVQVKNFFLANNTAYIVMEYVEGTTLKQYVADHGGRLSAEETLSILRPVIEALCKVHKAGLVHRDISPDNIMMLPSGGVKLLDFGAVRDVGEASVDKPLTKSTEAILKQGYAPIEQYQKHGSLGPWTDVYALCATIYYCLTGQVPPDAPERLLGYEDLNLREKVPALSEDQAKALEHGMALRAEQRTDSMDTLY